MRGLFDNPRRVVFAVVAVLVLAFTYRACSASEAYLELGPAFTGEFNGGLGLVYTERLGDRFDLGLHLVSDQQWDGKSAGNNGGVTASIVFARPADFWRALPSEVHIGASAWIATDENLIGCHLGYNLGLRWRLSDRFHVGWRHWSNAGTCEVNRGQDLLVFGARF